MIRGIACAKINLSLHVGTRQANGLHRLAGLFQSISWVDQLALRPADEDTLRTARGGDVIAGWDNLAWRALTEVRLLAGTDQPVELILDKAVPAAAGLGGGSADAAAALALGAHLFRVDRDSLPPVAAELGSDVPFCFVGGTAEVGGTGEELRVQGPLGGFALALVVPPIELATSAVYAKWDELGGPQGPLPPEHALPPALRGASLANDLLPAAVAVDPTLEDWRTELSARWGRPVLLTGSGPTLFGFFVDSDEAAAALDDAPRGVRGAAAVRPVPFGWALRDGGGPAVASAPVDAAGEQLIAGLFT